MSTTQVGQRKVRGHGRLAAGLLLYNLALLLALPFLVLWLAFRSLVRRKAMGSWRHRVGWVPRGPQGPQPRLWLHAVSAGEMGALQPVVTRLREALPKAWLTVSTVTSTGFAAAQRAGAAADSVVYLPFDWGDCIGLGLLRVRPHLVVVVERELWPNFLGMARLLGAEVLVVNGRVSDRLMGRYRRFPWLVRWLYALPSFLCVQSAEDAARLARIGVPEERVLVTGNTKVDLLSARDVAAEAALADALGVHPEEQWLVAGSTHAGEEEVLLAAFARMREQAPRTRLLLAPRHVERVPEVCAQVAAAGFAAARRSEGRPASDAVVVLDTMGELRAAYGLGVVGFVGGTLVPIGGHNLLEPVAAGRPVLFGPHTEYCADTAELVLEAGVGVRTATAEEATEACLHYLRDAARCERTARAGEALIASQQGATQRCANIALALLQEARGD